MAAPSFSTPFQPYVYQSPHASITPFQILGGESQIAQIMLKSQEKITAKPGSMCYMSGSIQMDNIIPEHEGGMWQWIFGKNATSIVLFNPGPDDGYVGIAAPSPARILPIDMANFGGEILCQPDAFLCSVNDVRVADTIEQRGHNVVVGAEGILKKKLVGQGLIFLIAGGSVVQKTLDAGEVLVVDTSCIVAVTSSIEFQVKHSTSMRRLISGGNNQLTATLTGPGIVFIQSLPFHRLAKQIARAVTSANVRDNPRFFVQIVIFVLFAYVMILSSLILTDF